MNKRDLKFGYSPGRLIDNAQRNFTELYDEAERLKNKLNESDMSVDAKLAIVNNLISDLDTRTAAEISGLNKRIDSINKNPGLNGMEFVIGTDGSKYQWEEVGVNKFKCRIEKKDHGFSNVYLDDAFAYLDDADTLADTLSTTEKIILSSQRLINDTLLIYSGSKIKCKVILKGENY